MSLPHRAKEVPAKSKLEFYDCLYGGGLRNFDSAVPSWQNIREAVRSSRNLQGHLADHIPHNFTFVPHENERSGFRGAKLLFLGVLPGYRENALLYVYVQSTQSPHLLDKPVKWRRALDVSPVIICS